MPEPNPSRIADGKVVAFHFILADAETGERLDSSEGKPPRRYLHGSRNVVPGLERAMEGRAQGDHFAVTLEPSEGFGERVAPKLPPVARAELGADRPLQPGMRLTVTGPGQAPTSVWITRIEGDEVYIDLNHPLSGRTLHYQVTVVEVREATDLEVVLGHPAV